LLALTAAVTLSLANSAQADLIVNGGFETGDFSGWTQSGDLQDTFVQGGTSPMSPNSSGFQAFLGPPKVGLLAQALATTPGASYTIDFRLAAQNPQANFFALKWGGTTIFSLTNTPGFGYTEYTFNVTASSATTALQFQFLDHLGNFFLDNVSVNPCIPNVPDTGSTFSLLGFASLGLVALRRKLSC
jgi:hypothetical protein